MKLSNVWSRPQSRPVCKLLITQEGHQRAATRLSAVLSLKRQLWAPLHPQPSYGVLSSLLIHR